MAKRKLAEKFKLNPEEDGFFTLIPKKKKASESTPKKSKDKDKKVKPPKFKKGGWKHWLYKKLKNWHSSKFVSHFHFEKRENILIACHKDPVMMFFNRKIDKDTLKELKALAGKDMVVLVDAGDKTYLEFSIKSYLKLMEIDKMIISFRLRANNDGVEIVDVFDREDVIDNINDLAEYINHHRRGIDGVYEIQANCCCYTDYEFKMKIVVIKADGSVETYKGDMNDFMKVYDIYPF